LVSENDLTKINKTETIISGNVKALIPLMRERLILDYDESNKARYMRGDKMPIVEDRIFGVMTKH
jgi:hypothetical protein